MKILTKATIFVEIMTDDRNSIKPQMLHFDEYIRLKEPDKREKAYIWRTAIGLQAVDGLKTSDYLKKTARRHIEGEIDIEDVRKLIRTYYESKKEHEPNDAEKQEADKVSANITKILSSKSFDFSTKGYISLHRRIFDGVFQDAGKMRTYNIKKREWVLDGDSVSYLNWEDLHRSIDYDIAKERNFSYQAFEQKELIAHITQFVSGLWQIHPFSEGNTRTTAVFTILYLDSIGFKVNNEMFAEHSWYFRNALVRANYKNAIKGIDYSPLYLERFFQNLLLGEQWDLRNRYLHINPTKEWQVQPNFSDSALNELSAPYKVPNNIPNKVPNKKGAQYPELSKAVLAVYLKLKENPNATAEALGHTLGISSRMVRKHIAALRKADIIERIGSNKTGYWRVK